MLEDREQRSENRRKNFGRRATRKKFEQTGQYRFIFRMQRRPDVLDQLLEQTSPLLGGSSDTQQLQLTQVKLSSPHHPLPEHTTTITQLPPSMNAPEVPMTLIKETHFAQRR